MDWKLKLLKLKNVILSSVDPSEPPPVFLKWVAAHKALKGARVSTDDVEEMSATAEVLKTAFADVRFMWEPLSDMVGRPSDHYGWKIDLSMYTDNGVAHWIAVATFLKKPLTGDLASIGRAVQFMGGDPEASLVKSIPGEDNGYWQRWYTWENRDEMTEMHFKRFVPTGDEQRDAMLFASNSKLVARGSEVLSGYERMPSMPSIVPREKN